MKLGVVVPVGGGRRENVEAVLAHLEAQDGLGQPKLPVVLVCDGEVAMSECGAFKGPRRKLRVDVIGMEKQVPGTTPPRNVGARFLHEQGVEWAWFVDSDVIVEPGAYRAILAAIEQGPDDAVICGAYDWLAPGPRSLVPRGGHGIGEADYRWEMFDTYPVNEVLRYHLGAALANFSGNLVWPLEEFFRVGGFNPGLTAGRVDDGELGVRASVGGVGTRFCKELRGVHLWHPINFEWVTRINAEEVPLINAWHPYIESQGIVPVPEDGVRLNMVCRECGAEVNTLEMWGHTLSHSRGALWVPLRGRDGELRGRAIIDEEDGWAFQYRWSLGTNGYAHRKTSEGSRGEAVQRNHYLHREVLGVGDDLTVEVDHINGDRLDNRRANLRTVPKGANAQNRHDANTGASRFRGVARNGAAWKAQGSVDGRTVYIGGFRDEFQAALAAECWRVRNMPYSEPDPELLAVYEELGIDSVRFRMGTGRGVGR